MGTTGARSCSLDSRFWVSTTSTTHFSHRFASQPRAHRLRRAQRDRRLLLTGALCIAVIAGSTLVNLTPSFYSWHVNGRPLILRDKVPAESEIFGLKIRQLISPVYPHVSVPSRGGSKGSGCAVSERQRELVVAARARRHARVPRAAGVALRPGHQATRTMPLLRGASRLTLAALLLATVGGFGTVFNLFVSADIRAYNRISPFIAFFSLFAVVVVIDRIVQDAARPHRGGRRHLVGRRQRSGTGDAKSQQALQAASRRRYRRSGDRRDARKCVARRSDGAPAAISHLHERKRFRAHEAVRPLQAIPGLAPPALQLSRLVERTGAMAAGGGASRLVERSRPGPRLKVFRPC